MQDVAQLREMDFDLALTGFSPEDLERLLKPGTGDGLTDPDAVPEPPGEAVTLPGDLRVLGRRRVLCGDSAKAADVDHLLDGAPIHLVNTDPPYGVRVEPRSNNAIAAGLSSFQRTTHRRQFDVDCHPEKSKPTTRKLRPVRSTTSASVSRTPPAPPSAALTPSRSTRPRRWDR
jgi:hypothetical protein